MHSTKLMSTDSSKQYILPFQRDCNEQVEAGAILAVAELERIKESGFINKQLGEKLSFIIKSGYPLWIFSRNNKQYLFDGLNDFNYTISYPNIPKAKILIEELQTKEKLIELYMEYLSSYDNCCQNPIVNKFMLKGLISDPEVRNEFVIYHPEANLLTSETNSYHAFLTPCLNQKAIEDNFRELGSLLISLNTEAENLSEWVELVRQTTDQHRTELDFQLTATTEEAEAKIRACENLVIPQLNKINRMYKRKIDSVTNAFNKRIREQESNRKRAEKSVDKAEEKISDYRIETQRQASYGHYYERRWQKKFARLDRELRGCTRKLESIESRLERLINAKETEILNLNSELNSQTQLISQPLRELEEDKDRKIVKVQKIIQQLIHLEGRLIDGINKNIEAWKLERSFESFSLKGISFTNSALVYVPFYFICYQAENTKRFLVVPPSSFGTIDFSAKFKGVFGVTKTKDLLNARFQTLAILVQKIQTLASQNLDFQGQMLALAEKENLLKENSFKENAKSGLNTLKQEGWLSDKEVQFLSHQLFHV